MEFCSSCLKGSGDAQREPKVLEGTLVQGSQGAELTVEVGAKTYRVQRYALERGQQAFSRAGAVAF